MISTPIPDAHWLADASSTPRPPSDRPCCSRKARVGKNHSWSLWPACPKGVSKLCPSPVPNPSSDTEKLWTRTSDTGPPGVQARVVVTDEHFPSWRTRPTRSAVRRCGGEPHFPAVKVLIDFTVLVSPSHELGAQTVVAEHSNQHIP